MPRERRYLLRRDGPPLGGRDGALRVGAGARGAGRADGPRDEGVGDGRALGMRPEDGAGLADGDRRPPDWVLGAARLGVGMLRGSTCRMGAGIRLRPAVLPVADDALPLDPPAPSVRRGAGASFAMARPRGGAADGARSPPDRVGRGPTSVRRSSVPTGRSDSVAGTAVAVRRGGDGSRYDPSSIGSPTVGVRVASDSD